MTKLETRVERVTYENSNGEVTGTQIGRIYGTVICYEHLGFDQLHAVKVDEVWFVRAPDPEFYEGHWKYIGDNPNSV